MKKKVIAFVASIMMVLALVPTFAFAAEGDEVPNSVTVYVRSQMAGAYLHSPTDRLSVPFNIAENYGYTDSITDGVSALDALVAEHELIFEGDFNKENKDDYLKVDENGYISVIFGVPTYGSGFMINGGYPNDGTESSWGGYNGTTVSTQAIDYNDIIDFYIYQDESYYSDYYTWLETPGLVDPGEEFTVNAAANMVMMGYMYADPESFKDDASAENTEDMQLAWVDDNGAVEVIEGATLDEEGTAVIEAPAKAGRYNLTAYNDEEGYSFAIMNPEEIWVADQADVLNVKKTYMEAVKAYYIDNVYQPDDLAYIHQLVVTAYEDIAGAEDVSELESILAQYRADVDFVPTKSDYDAIESSALAGVSAKNIKGKKIKISWKANKHYDGYQIYYKRSGASAKRVYVNDIDAVTKTVKGLKKGKTYTVKIRGYKNISGKTVYSKYVTKKVKIKK